MVTIIFESHASTTDNEAHLSSGHNDVDLSETGVRQAQDLGERYKNDHFDAIFCSDLQRAYKTGQIAFGDRNWPIIQDVRLRECDYGGLTQHPSAEVDAEKIKHVSVPFPDGESYEQAAARVYDFLQDIIHDYDGKKIMVIGHRATQYGLERYINGVSLQDSVAAHDTWKWRPGWTYELKQLRS